MRESRSEEADSDMPPRVLGAALASGILLAFLVAVAARLETGYPPGITPPPFARLIGQPAPAFALDGLQGDKVSSDDAPAGRSGLLFFADATCRACDATYPALAQPRSKSPWSSSVQETRPSSVRNWPRTGLVSAAGHDSLRQVIQTYGVPAYPYLKYHAVAAGASYRESGRQPTPSTLILPDRIQEEWTCEYRSHDG